LTFSVLHGVISHKTDLFITAIMRTSNPTIRSHLSTKLVKSDLSNELLLVIESLLHFLFLLLLLSFKIYVC
jgi:hypothetical protein